MVDNTQSSMDDSSQTPNPLAIIADGLKQSFPDVVESYDVVYDELSLRVSRQGILAVMAYLRDEPSHRYAQLIDICGVDYPDRSERFDVVYQLLSIKHNARIRVKVSTDEETPVPSISSLFSTAPWFEREVWDMFGVMFDGLADHRRILTDYGFDGHPLRKDFPLSGHVEVRYDDEKKRVVYDSVSLPQDFRMFDNLSPWEGVTDVQLPGDEKSHMPKVGWKPTIKIAE